MCICVDRCACKECVCISVGRCVCKGCVCIFVGRCACKGRCLPQEKVVLDPVEVELQVVVELTSVSAEN